LQPRHTMPRTAPDSTPQPRKSSDLETTPLRAVPPLEETHHPQAGIVSLTITALGIVYGDIGTSPLYALRECFHPGHGLALSNENILGVLSLIFWALTLVVVVKYLAFIMRADNRGEGGILSLIALILPSKSSGPPPRSFRFLIPLGLFGAALLYGDGVITPAISVLSAIEGLRVATPAFEPVILPLTVGILFVLFAVQRRGTEKIGSVFGIATMIWFLVIAAIGFPWILKRPEILYSLNPTQAIGFFTRNGLPGFLVLGAVVLCITGAEALYADMGHFGKKPIRLGWFALVFPSLIINYLGQGALILEKQESALENPFYGLVSGWQLYPLVVLATIATVIASQALISGAYSLTHQAIQLGYFPRTLISHTSKRAEGQIFIGQVNRFLMVGSIALVLVFQRSSGLAAAYGIAVTGTMAVSSFLFFAVARHRWRWPLVSALGLTLMFLAVDLAFFSANMTKFAHGGWIPILIAMILFAIMTTWKKGRDALASAMLTSAVPLEKFLSKLDRQKPTRVPGTAIFMTATEDVAPYVLLHHYKHNQVLKEQILLLTIVTKNVPYADESERVSILPANHGFYKVKARYGFMEAPNISEILIHCLGKGLIMNVDELSFYLGRETILVDGDSKLPLWRKKAFVLLSRNARPVTDYFGLPPDQVIEVGAQVSI